MTKVKICGLSEPESVTVAANAGAAFIGFVFYKASPRYVTPEQAGKLARLVSKDVEKVGLFVNPSEEDLENALKHVDLTMLQLHGQESPQHLAQIRGRFSLPIIKAFNIADQSDLEELETYDPVADWFLLDSKPQNASMPGGTGIAFDWSVLENRTFTKPWMLSGGLNAKNIETALKHLEPDALDVSSGVESEPGVKDLNKIKAFIEKTKEAI